MRLLILLGAPLFVGLLLGAGEAEGQIRPGIERGDYWGGVRARYRRETLEEVGILMDAWFEAWNRGDVVAVTQAFSDDGILVLDGAPLRGRAAIEDALSTREPVRLVQSLADFDVRGEMAFATVRHGLARAAGPVDVGPGGLELWVFVKEGGDWRIRSLTIWVRGDGGG